jgi:hypothetical protein
MGLCEKSQKSKWTHSGENMELNIPELEKALVNMRKSMKITAEYERLRAVITRQKYDALLEQNFTEAQALELCKER